MFAVDRIKALFQTKKLALSTGLIMTVWAFIGLGYVDILLGRLTRANENRYPLYNAYLPFIQASRGADFGDGST